jgi:nucleoside-diphosphate-sugar epimerase
VFVEDVAEACLLAAKTPHPGEIFNVGTGVQRANEEVIEAIEHLTGQTIHIELSSYPPHLSDTAHWVADVEKTKKVLGWSACHTLEEGLAKTIGRLVA